MTDPRLKTKSEAASFTDIRRQSSGTRGSQTRATARFAWKTGWRVLLVVALTALLAWLADYAVGANLKKHLGAQLKTQVDSTAAALNSWSKDVLRSLAEIANDPTFVEVVFSLADPKDPDARTTSRKAAAFLGEIHSLVHRTSAEGYMVTNLDGKIVSATHSIQVGQQLPLDADAFHQWVAAPVGRFWAPKIYAVGVGKKVPFLTFSSPVLRDGRPIGILHLLIDPTTRFSSILERARTGTTGESYAFNSQGLMISESRFLEQSIKVGLLPPGTTSTILKLSIRDPGFALGPNSAPVADDRLPFTHLVSSALTGDDGLNVDGYRDCRGDLVVGAWKWIDESDFGIAVEVGVEEAYDLRGGLRLVLAGLFFVLLVTSGIGLWISHRNLELKRRSELAERKVERLGQYSLGRKLGEGGMGSVYIAHHAMLRRPTAIKLITPPASGQISADRFARFEREVQHTAELSHPNTISIFDFGKTPGGVLYYAMEYVEGIDLDELVRRTGPLSPARAIYLVIQACGSLAEAHDHGMVHRDIKPNNIMVCKHGGEYDRIKVLDFGLVKSLEGENRDATVTAENAITGTPLYMAPEILLNSASASPRSDIYALGAVMYYLLSGSTLFPHREGMAVLVAQTNEKPRPLSELCPSLSVELCALIHRCLDKSPVGRPDNMRSLARDLRAAVPSTWGQEDAQSWWDSHSELLQEKGGPEESNPSASQVDELGSAATQLVSN